MDIKQYKRATLITEDEEIDYTKFKYVLYARKSTTDEARQVRSIPDQILECQKLASRMHLNIIGKPLKETQSAKKPRQRPIFRKMISDIKAGVYDAILAWNPDRLARNMLEGGEIINLIDEGILQDLRFVTHYFTKDANGKMLLGMAFVLSKQYSDDLSQKITRGTRNKFAEGKTQTPKYGYTNEEGMYKTDGKNFKLISEAWRMRINETPIEDICDFLNKSGYFRLIKSSGEKQIITKQKLSRMFQDPFYYGVLIQANQSIDLREIYDFVPAVSEDDFFKIQSLSYRKMKASKPHKDNYYPFRLMIYCDFCKMSMRVAPSTGKSRRYLYARCDNKQCIRNSKNKPKDFKYRASVRTKWLLDFVSKFIKGGLNLTEKDYNNYYNKLIQINDEKRQELRAKLNNQRGVLKHYNQEVTDRSLGITKLEKGSPAWQINSREINRLLDIISGLELSIKQLEVSINTPEHDQLSIEQFLNLSKNAENIIKVGDQEVKDKICRIIFANFFMDGEKVTDYRLNEPFDTLLKQPSFLNGGDGGN